jgi:glycosyltransferase involved in cell wall biosynthesis
VRLLFVSSTTVGGSGRSQRELAAQLVDAGHQVTFLVDDETPSRLRRWAYEQLSDLAVRVGDRPGGRVVRALERLPGRQTGTLTLDGVVHVTTPVPQNALTQVIDDLRPHVVVGNSLERLSWRRIRAAAAERGLPTVLYIREEDSLGHLVRGEEPDAVVANAEALRAAVERRGFACLVVPSVIDVERTRATSTRQTVLAINPVESRGGKIVWQVAAALSDIPFVVQESWPLQRTELLSVEQHVRLQPNVEFRRAAPPGPELYADARVLMVPYRVNNRPRVIAEAQANGIPIIAADLPALREAVGDGGLLVDLDDIDGWCTAIRSVYEDDELYEHLTSSAAEHGRRPALDPATVARTFAEVVNDVIERGP